MCASQLLSIRTVNTINPQKLSSNYVAKPYHIVTISSGAGCNRRGRHSVQFSSVAQSCPTLCDPMNCSIPGNGNPLRYSCLENPMDGGAWWAAVHGVSKSRTGLRDFTFTFHLHALEKEMATHSSVLAWRIPGTREPGGLPSMGSHRVGHD